MRIPLSGLQQPIEPAYGEVVREGHVIGLHVQKTCEDKQFVRNVVEKGVQNHPDAVWVVFETDHAARIVLTSLGIDHVLLPLNPWWKTTHGDWRRSMRDQELLLADEVVVFQREGAVTDWADRARKKDEYGIHQHLYVVEVGAPKPKRRPRSRKPVGA